MSDLDASQDQVLDDPVDAVRARLDGLEELPVTHHVRELTIALDEIIGELDKLARSIPPAR